MSAIRERLTKLLEEAAGLLEQQPFDATGLYEMAAQVERDRIIRLLGYRLQGMPTNEPTRTVELDTRAATAMVAFRCSESSPRDNLR
jgi:hypothetical protein